MDQEAPEDPIWVETQSFALVEFPSNTLMVSWSRSVNNRVVMDEHPLRVFLDIGMGRLHKASEDCSGFK
jgi:hypothetical protein